MCQLKGTSVFPPQHVSLDHLNLRLADIEFSVEAFAAFRSSQLQPPRVYLLDPSAALPYPVELGSDLGSEVGLGGAGREGAGELRDLALVSSNVLMVQSAGIHA